MTEHGVMRGCETKLIGEAPLEMLELILMRAFVMLYVHHYKTAMICAGERAYSTLARVSSIWWQTLDGWPQSDTRLWLKHQIVKRVGSQFFCCIWQLAHTIGLVVKT